MITLQTQYWQQDQSSSGSSATPETQKPELNTPELTPSRFNLLTSGPLSRTWSLLPDLRLYDSLSQQAGLKPLDMSYHEKPLLDANRAEELLQSARILQCNDQVIIPPNQHAHCCVTVRLDKFSFNFGLAETSPTRHDSFAP
jgi:hypothetical protein